MKSILEEFDRENISQDLGCLNNDLDLGHAMKRLAENEERLLNLLDDSGKEILKNYCDALMEINSLACIDKLICGYRHGMLTAVEFFRDKKI